MFSFSSRLAAQSLQRRLPLLRLSLGVAGTFAALTLAVLPAASAQAASTGACTAGGGELSQPFAQWGDSNSYELVPGGDFEGSLSGWTVSGDAQQVAESEPYGATGSVGSSSLELPAGASAQSPSVCVDASYPSFRFFARNDSGPVSTVLVRVVFKTSLGLTLSLPVGVLVLHGEWQPTQPMLTDSNLTGLLSGRATQVAFRFTALSGSSRIDDVFIDPRMR